MSKNKQLRKKITENTQNNQNAFLARRGFAFVIDFIVTLCDRNCIWIDE